MDRKDFNYQFDVLYNNITSNQAPGLNIYEKSVFLTKAERELVQAYFNPKTDPIKSGFDGDQIRQMNFSGLISQKAQSLLSPDNYVTLDPRAKIVDLHNLNPAPYIIINESIIIGDNKVRQVLPISYADYSIVMQEPYKEPLKWQAWRLISNKSNSSPTMEIILNAKDRAEFDSNSGNLKYIIKYVRKPNPIILDNLNDLEVGLTIEGNSGPSDCELNPITHTAILERAVTLAKLAWAGSNSTIQESQQRQRSND